MNDTQNPAVVFGNVRFGHAAFHAFWQRPFDSPDPLGEDISLASRRSVPHFLDSRACIRAV